MKAIDCDTHYPPVELVDRVVHPDRGDIERAGGGAAAFWRGGKLVHRFRTSRRDRAGRFGVAAAARHPNPAGTRIQTKHPATNRREGSR